MRESIADSSSGRGGAKLRAVGLEIEEGRAVDAVEPPDIEDGALAGDERHDGRPDRVGPHRRADGEGPLREAVPARTLPHEIAAGLMQPVEDLDPLERLDPFERRGPRRADLDPAEGPVGAAVVRAVGARWPRRPDDADEDEAGVDRMRPVDRNLVLTDVVVRRHDGSGGPLQGPRSSPGLPASGSRGRLLSRRIDAMLAFPHWLVNSGLMPSRRATPSATPSPRPARGSAKGPTREALLAALAERERELAEALARQTATSEILRVISQSPTDAKPVFQRIVVTAARLLRCDMVFVLLRDGDAYVQTAGATPEGPMADLAPERFPIDENANFPSRAFLAKTMLHLPNWSLIELPEHERRIHDTFGVNSALYLPLLRGDECIGLLVFGGRLANIFGPGEIAQAESFRDQALIAIENARLFNETTEALARQTATSEVLQVIGSSVSDAAPAFDKILESCQRLFNGAQAVLSLVCEDGQVYHHTINSVDPETARQLNQGFPRPLAQAYQSYPIRKKRVVHYPDILNGPGVPEGMREIARRAPNFSMLIAPMFWAGRGIGTIHVVRFPPVPFSDKDAALLKTFADQAVIAIQNARLFNETQEALGRQTATADVLKVIASSPSDVQPVFDAIAANANRLIGARSTTVYRLVDDELHIAALTSIDPEADEAFRALFPRPAADLWAFQAVRGGKSLQFADIEAEPSVPSAFKDTARNRGLRAYLFTPLMCDGDAIGAFTVARAEPGAFAPHHVELLQTFADQVVIAVQNARLFNETREALEQQKASAEVLGAISKSVADTAPVFEAIIDACQRLFGSEEIGVYTIGDDDMVRVAAWRGPQAEEVRHDVTPVGESVTGRIIRERRTHHIPDLAVEPGISPTVRERAKRLGSASLLYAPMLSEERGLGSILVVRSPPRPFSDREQTLLQTFADQAAIAIENARLFHETQEALRQQTATSDILRV